MRKLIFQHETPIKEYTTEDGGAAQIADIDPGYDPETEPDAGLFVRIQSYDTSGRHEEFFKLVAADRVRVTVVALDAGTLTLPPDEDTGGAYIQNMRAQEAAYWTAREQGIRVNDFEIAALLRAAAPYIRAESEHP